MPARKRSRAAFYRLGAKVHPDRGGSNALFRRVKDAYDTLSDPQRRAAYDRLLIARTGAGPPAAYDDRAWVGAQATSGWALSPAQPGGAVPLRPGPSFVARHFGPAALAFGALVIAIFVVAYTVAGPVVLDCPLRAHGRDGPGGAAGRGGYSGSGDGAERPGSARFTSGNGRGRVSPSGANHLSRRL